MTDKKSKKIYARLIFALFLLFNPNFNIVDILPDFIAYFIIFGLLEKPSDSSAYFEEAATSFRKLAYVTLAKVPAFFLIILIRSKDAQDRDIYALAVTIFAILELFYLIPAIRNLFDALFHLGERTDAQSLIKPFKVFGKDVSPEFLRNLTYVFVVTKTLLYVIPQMLILTTTNNHGVAVLPTARYYPYAVITAHVIGIVFGLVWLIFAKSYARAVKVEGKFDNALEFMQTDSGRERFNNKVKVRKVRQCFTLLAVASFFSLELEFSNLEEINLLPHFIYGFVLLLTMRKCFEHTRRDVKVYISGVVYMIVSAVSYIFHFMFLTKYDYIDLIDSSAAVAAYRPLLYLSVAETLALLVYLFFCAASLRDLIKENTGLTPPGSEKYSPSDREYHRGLITKTFVLFGISALAGIAKCVNVFLNRDVSVIYSDITDVTKPTFAASALPWFGLVVTALSIAYILYSLYLTSTLKDEVEHKYTE